MREAVFLRVLEVAKRDNFNEDQMFKKLIEEVGEFSEALNHSHGLLPHKTMKEPTVGEVADVIQCVIAVYLKNQIALNGRVDLHRVAEELVTAIYTKNQKWLSVIRAREERELAENPPTGTHVRFGDSSSWYELRGFGGDYHVLKEWAHNYARSCAGQDSDSGWTLRMEFDVAGTRWYATADFYSPYDGGGELAEFDFGTLEEINSNGSGNTVYRGEFGPVGEHVTKGRCYEIGCTDEKKA